MITQHLIVNLILILTVAWFLGRVFARFGLPVVLGELLAGIILGPPLLGIISTSEPIELLAEFGIFFLMFYAGLEMDPKEAVEHLWPSTAVAIGGFVLPFVFGYLVCMMFGGTSFQSLFVGMGISVTAIAVQSRILHDMHIHNTSLGHIIIGAAIVNDILALISLSILLELAESGTVQVLQVAFIVFKVAVFFGFTILIGQFVIPRFIRKLDDREGKAFTFALVCALAMAYFAELAGLHLIIGAFLAGQFVRKEIMDIDIYQKISDRFYGISYGFMAPIFFVSLSFHLHIQWQWSFIFFTITITLIAIIGKVLGCGFGAYLFRKNFWESTIIGSGMNGRGAVEMVIAAVVIELSDKLIASHTIREPLLTQDQFAALICMAFITTLIAPLSLKWTVKRSCSFDENIQFNRLWEKSKKG
ncbi:MAG: cation:proton antiporter [Candidatus Scalindua sp.]|jgi:Kef-type K+ transport system membrane component KefB|nr:cation:proton antiporter [Candidatus Scalindua sp.]MBT5305214.1 cation:proton antiporter [Candidatus Scalindua sp.]MBT6229234.1 cation:proton antiporter [Candidatus Scalindua sp.]MBT6561102.1 cation:proton antiporter [Candidatus Scalindua sp.]MBT7212590.1 cation:proton antiporter [Candidatus Scalindua sp.]